MKWQSVLDLARDTLNDAEKTRYPDDDALRHGNDAIREAYAIRPDLKIGTFGTSYVDATNPETTDFPLPDQYRRAVADYIIGRMETKDDEYVNNGRAVMALQLFQAQMV